MFNAIKYFRDKRIDLSTDGQKSSEGWVNVQCPFCWHSQDEHKPYLGFNLAKGYFHCWRCGGHSTEDYILITERVDYPTACRIAMEYDDDMIWRPPPGQKTPQGLNGHLDWPPGIMPLQNPHRHYLIKRNFDPDYLIKKYGLRGTGPVGSYSGRIIAPIFLDGRMVSYQGRDITGKHELRYKACRKELELVDHKTILYNIDNCRGDAAICVEGITDVWRLGDDTFGTFGTTVTEQQISMMVSRFRRVFVMSDAEIPAQRGAKKLCDQLSAQGLKATRIALERGDPAELDQDYTNDMKGKLLSG